jgi:hypothetical protein
MLPRHRARRAYGALRGALVAGILASSRSCHVEAIQTRRHSAHKCKPSCGAVAESLACSISGNGRGLTRGAARGIQYSVATSFYPLDRKSFVGLACRCQRLAWLKPPTRAATILLLCHSASVGRRRLRAFNRGASFDWPQAPRGQTLPVLPWNGLTSLLPPAESQLANVPQT